ncbi:hypothetical protein CBI38_24680 [Rhodococcus oxybenzonivorans]|uniref:Uncharacterized protein n=1 Tax=Rhodococcus oxybenzonivorans TaxID=1990687 RepID=A0A2S2C0E1_9NOCA|nr:hypothetical protein [Rhodococcus oxybenzonivorans]AWK74274.1 hypothetical protein CBI38_24680 [Rhodococcus oxybenzonivorans]
MTLSAASIKRFHNAVTTNGGTIPETLLGITDNLEAINAWQPAPAGAALTAALSNGKFNAKTAAQHLDGALAEVHDPNHVAKVRGTATLALCTQYEQEIKGAAGDELVESLRPSFDAALEGLRTAAGMFSLNAAPDQILELGHDAVDAYNAIPNHRLVLDRMWHDIIGWLVVATGDGPQVLGQPRIDRVADALRLVMVMPAPRGSLTDLTNAIEPVTTNRLRVGHWGRLMSLTPLHLNSPSEARTVLDAYLEDADASMAAQLAASHSS